MTLQDFCKNNSPVKTDLRSIKEIAAYKQRLVIRAMCRDLGLDQLTEDEETQIQSEADRIFQGKLSSVRYNNDYRNLSAEEKKQKAYAEITSKGYTMNSALENARDSFLSEKLKHYLTRDVIVNEDDIRKEYDKRVAAAKKEYENNAMKWCHDADKCAAIYYTPPGIRFIKQITIRYVEKDRAALENVQQSAFKASMEVDGAGSNLEDIVDDMTGNGGIEITDEIIEHYINSLIASTTQDMITDPSSNKFQLEEELDDCRKELIEALRARTEAKEEEIKLKKTAYLNLEKSADQFLAELANGADWDVLMEKNPGYLMSSEINSKRGKAITVSPYVNTLWEIGLSLKNIGDISDKLRDYQGISIIKYVGDAEEGPIDLERVRDEIKESLLSRKKDEIYQGMVQSRVNDAVFIARLFS